jgi:hypothetical protein
MWKLHNYACFNGHEFEALEDSKDDEWSECEECGLVAKRQIGGIGRMLWYEEGRSRMDYHLGHRPVEITSERQHQKEMKKAGVALAGTRRGMPGQWV